MHYDSFSFLEYSLTMMHFDSSLSVELICDRFSLTRNPFNFLLYIEKRARLESIYSSHLRSHSVSVQVEGIISHQHFASSLAR